MCAGIHCCKVLFSKVIMTFKFLFCLVFLCLVSVQLVLLPGATLLHGNQLSPHMSLQRLQAAGDSVQAGMFREDQKSAEESDDC